MRVLWVTTFPPRRCGIGDYASDLASQISRNRDPELRIVTYPDGVAQRVARENGFEVSRSLGGASPNGNLAAEIRSFDPDLLHLQSASFLHRPSVNEAVAACEVPLITTVHDTPGSWRAFRVLRGLRRVYERSRRLLVHSPEVGRILSGLHAVDADRIVTLPHGVDLDKYSPHAPTGDALRNFGLSGRRIVLFFGFVRPGKGLETLLRAWQRIEASHPDTVLVLAGGIPSDPRRYHLLLKNEADYPRELMNLAAALGISDRLLSTGYVPGHLVPGLLASSEVVVLPYVNAIHQSGPLHKSLASGRAIVATNIGGFRELLEDGRDSILVPPGEPEPLADAIGGLLDDPARASDIATQAREKAEKSLGWSAVAARTLEVYQSLLTAVAVS